MRARNDNATPVLIKLGGVRSICGNGSDRRQAIVASLPGSWCMRPARFHHVAQRVTNGIASEARSSHHDGRRQRQQRMNVVRVHHCCLMCLRADTASPATGPVACVLRVGFSHWRASLRGASTQDPTPRTVDPERIDGADNRRASVVAVHYVARGRARKSLD